MKTLREIIVQKTDQWHQTHPVHLTEQGVLVAKLQTRTFDKSPVFQMFMDSLQEWLTQKRLQIVTESIDISYRDSQTDLIEELLGELKK